MRWKGCMWLSSAMTTHSLPSMTVKLWPLRPILLISSLSGTIATDISMWWPWCSSFWSSVLVLSCAWSMCLTRRTKELRDRMDGAMHDAGRSMLWTSGMDGSMDGWLVYLSCVAWFTSQLVKSFLRLCMTVRWVWSQPYLYMVDWWGCFIVSLNYYFMGSVVWCNVWDECMSEWASEWNCPVACRDGDNFSLTIYHITWCVCVARHIISY